MNSWKPRATFVNSEPEAIGATTVGDLPAELLGRLERERLGALGVVRRRRLTFTNAHGALAGDQERRLTAS